MERRDKTVRSEYGRVHELHDDDSTLMVTRGPLPPLQRAQWWQSFWFLPMPMRPPSQLERDGDCLWWWSRQHRRRERGRALAAVNTVALELFPQRVPAEMLTSDGSVSQYWPAAYVNDHPATTFADVCKILDEANRRLA